MAVPSLQERIERGRKEREEQPLVTADQKGKQYTWDIFWKGSEGYAEHLQVAFDTSEEFIEKRSSIALWLGSIGAETLPRDKEKEFPQRGAPRQAAPQATPGVTPVCPIDGGTMTLRPGGVSGPQSKVPGTPYDPFWACNNYKATGCRGSVKA